MPAPKPLRLRASALNPSRLAAMGLALVVAFAVLALVACGAASDDGRTPPPTTAPMQAADAQVTPHPPPSRGQAPTFPRQGGRGVVKSAPSAQGGGGEVAAIATVAIATPTPVPREIAPAFELAAGAGGAVSLAELLDGKRAAVLVFYRGLF